MKRVCMLIGVLAMVMVGGTQASANLLVNPGFESGFTSWITYPAEGGYTLSVNSTVSRNGQNSAKIEFDGTKDVNFWYVFQTVPVQPSTWYLVDGWVKANLTTSSGIRLQFWEHYGAWPNYRTISAVGSETNTGGNWWNLGWYFAVRSGTDQQNIFPGTPGYIKTSSDAIALTIIVRRVSGAGAISGTAWVDDLLVEPLSEVMAIDSYKAQIVELQAQLDECLEGGAQCQEDLAAANVALGECGEALAASESALAACQGDLAASNACNAGLENSAAALGLSVDDCAIQGTNAYVAPGQLQAQRGLPKNSNAVKVIVP